MEKGGELDSTHELWALTTGTTMAGTPRDPADQYEQRYCGRRERVRSLEGIAALEA